MAPSLVLGCFVEASSGRAWATCLDVDTLQVLASSGIAEEDVRRGACWVLLAWW
jgi:hypothetical protein